MPVQSFEAVVGGRQPRRAIWPLAPGGTWSGTVAPVDDRGDMSMRAIAQLALAVEENEGVDEAVKAALTAEAEPHRISASSAAC